MTIIGVVEKNRAEYWDHLNSGLRRAAERRGFDVRITAPEYEDIAAQRSLMLNHLERGVDALLFVASHLTAFTDVVDQAMTNGIPVLTMDLDGYHERRLFHVGTVPFTKLGRQAADMLLEQVTSDGPVIAQAGSHAPGAEGKLHGFLERMAEAGREVIVTPPDHEQLDKSEENLRSALGAHPEVAGVHGVYGYHPGIQARVLADIGKEPGSVPIVGFDMLRDTVHGIRNGSIAASIWIHEYSIGAVAGAVADLFATLPWDEALTVLGGDPNTRHNNIRRLPVTSFDATNIQQYEKWHNGYE